MTPFLRCFMGWVKKWVLLTVFWKAVFAENTILGCFQQSTATATKGCMLKKTDNYER